MDAVILAAGRGERLRDLTPAFHKPLLPIDGVPLVCRAVDLATDLIEKTSSDAGRVVVVVAPANAEAISGALGSRNPLLIVQREPRGPGHALWHGLQACTDTDVMVMLSDNVMSRDDVWEVYRAGDGIGVKNLPRTEAHRFTRFEDGRWVEKTPVQPYGGDLLCWVGPFVAKRSVMTSFYDELCGPGTNMSAGEVLIGPFLGSLLAEKWTPVSVDSYDVGTLESYSHAGRWR